MEELHAVEMVELPSIPIGPKQGKTTDVQNLLLGCLW